MLVIEHFFDAFIIMNQEKTKEEKMIEQAIEHIAWLFLEQIDEKQRKARKKK